MNLKIKQEKDFSHTKCFLHNFPGIFLLNIVFVCTSNTFQAYLVGSTKPCFKAYDFFWDLKVLESSKAYPACCIDHEEYAVLLGVDFRRKFPWVSFVQKKSLFLKVYAKSMKILKYHGPKNSFVRVDWGMKVLFYGGSDRGNLSSTSWPQAIAKQGDLSRATLFSVCLPRWLNMRVTSEQHVPRFICMSWRQEMFLLSPRNISVSLAMNIFTRYSEVAKLGDTEGTSMFVARDMSPNLARPLPSKSANFEKIRSAV